MLMSFRAARCAVGGDMENAIVWRCCSKPLTVICPARRVKIMATATSASVFAEGTFEEQVNWLFLNRMIAVTEPLLDHRACHLCCTKPIWARPCNICTIYTRQSPIDRRSNTTGERWRSAKDNPIKYRGWGEVFGRRIWTRWVITS